MTEQQILDLLNIGENSQVEFKRSQGELPSNIWPTVSAFANTAGGYIILGVDENKRKPTVCGVTNANHLITNFWNACNNSKKININPCTDKDVQQKQVQGKTVIVIYIPKQSRSKLPVYIDDNPKNTYKRNHEGDYKCREYEINQMIKDANDDPQDSIILEKFDLADLDQNTLKEYRLRFSSRDPSHAFLAKPDKEFLECLGGWRKDRDKGIEGLTIAGLLMFGRYNSIMEALPHYNLDYQEQLSTDPEARWTYRITIDGSWEPNLFNFYFLVYNRLVRDLNLPFKLDQNAIRSEETSVHKALREALVNTLVHANHNSSLSIKIIKRLNEFEFINPGNLRIPLEALQDGGVSDPRNPSLLIMFRFLGLSERAGSGFPTIFNAWKEHAWRHPLIKEDSQINITTVCLSMVSLLSEIEKASLIQIVGSEEEFLKLSELDIIILSSVLNNVEISNTFIQQHSNVHRRDIGDRLGYMVKKKWLSQFGRGPATTYKIYKERLDLFEQNSQNMGDSSQYYDNSSQYCDNSSQYYDNSSQYWQELEKIAEPLRKKKRVDKTTVKKVIVELCVKEALSLKQLSSLLNRDPEGLSNNYLRSMIKEGLIELVFPDNLTHPNQAYKAKK